MGLSLTKGFSKKRHMLSGNAVSKIKRNSLNKKVAVIGTGITGCTLSYMLAKKGIEVDLFEQSESICSGASSHELLVTYPRLSAHDSPFGRFNLQSYIYATNFYDNLETAAWKKTGVILLNHDESTQKRQSSLLEKRSDGEIYQYLNSDEASKISGIELKFNGLLYKDDPFFVSKLAELEIDALALEITEQRIKSSDNPGALTSVAKLVGTELGQKITELALSVNELNILISNHSYLSDLKGAYFFKSISSEGSIRLICSRKIRKFLPWKDLGLACEGLVVGRRIFGRPPIRSH